MPKLAIKEIEIDPTVQIRRGNHEPTIQRYMESFEKLPPVEVFRTPDGDLLADGFHRLAAAQRLGLREIEATIHKGTREDALEFAVVNNMKNADPLSPDERDDGIRRLKQLHPAWSLRQIGEALSVSYQTIQNVFRVDEVKRQVPSAVNRLTDSHFREIAKAPKEQWEPLAKAAETKGWSRDATGLARRNLTDDRIPEKLKRDILAGKSNPVAITPDGQFAVPAEIIGRELREMAANDAVLALERALEALAKLRLFRPDAIVSTIGRPRLDRLVDEMPGYIEFMEELTKAAQKHGRRMEVAR